MHGKRSEKRSYGSGSVRPKGNSWQGRWRHNGQPVTQTLGKIRSEQHPRGLTPKQAQQALVKAMAAYEPASPDSKMLFSEVADLHLEHVEAMNRKRSTVEDYRSCVKVHLNPDFGSMPVKAISVDDVERFQRKKLKQAQPKSVLNWMSILHGVLAFALKRGYVESNVAASVEKPKDDSERELRALNLIELESLLAATPDTKLGEVDRMLYLTAARTGLRQGELLGLRWRHIDFDAKRVRVQKNFVRGEHISPKSGKPRSVPMASTVDRELKEFFKRTRFNKDNDLVFCHPITGKELDRSRLLKRFKAAVTKAGVGEFEERTRKNDNVETVPLTTFHDLRHTFGTLCASAGISLRTIMEHMGHADIKTTMIYAHYAPGEEEAALIERAFTHKPLRATNGPQTQASHAQEQSTANNSEQA